VDPSKVLLCVKPVSECSSGLCSTMRFSQLPFPGAKPSSHNFIIWRDRAKNDADPFYALLEMDEVDPVNLQLSNRTAVRIF
jgi:hypothetical protein